MRIIGVKNVVAQLSANGVAPRHQAGARWRANVCAGIELGKIDAISCDVIDIGIIPTPTVEIAVTGLKAAGEFV